MNRYSWLNLAVEGLGYAKDSLLCSCRECFLLYAFCSERDRLLACSSSTAIAVFHRGVSVHADAIRSAICREYDVAHMKTVVHLAQEDTRTALYKLLQRLVSKAISSERVDSFIFIGIVQHI